MCNSIGKKMINLIFRKWLIHTTSYFRGLLNHKSWISAVFRIYMLFFHTVYQRMFEGLFFYISILFNLAVFKYVAYTSKNSWNSDQALNTSTYRSQLSFMSISVAGFAGFNRHMLKFQNTSNSKMLTFLFYS